MPVDVELIEGPLPRAGFPPDAGGAGALLSFEGVVRLLEGGRPLRALRYEAYEPMITNQLRALGAQVVRQWGLLGLSVWHSVGEVPVGAVSFRLQVASRHRREGLVAMERFIDRMKRQAPLWKVPLHAEPEDAAPGDRPDRGARAAGSGAADPRPREDVRS